MLKVIFSIFYTRIDIVQFTHDNEIKNEYMHANAQTIAKLCKFHKIKFRTRELLGT